MSSLGQIAGNFMSNTLEQTLALANVNFDFTLIKIDAPKEFTDVGLQLSSQRRHEAEMGSAHVLARKLGALFRDVIPATPELIKAYGKRASEISKTCPRESAAQGIFANAAGADATSMWAAATSGRHAIACHLLACLLARMWDGPEATSHWVELVSRRKREIATETSEIGDPALALVARESFQRRDLADWDASARAWLRVADNAKRVQQTQLRLILDNLSLPVNSKVETYESIMHAWRSALEQMERLLAGVPQEARDGAIILGLDSWHLYPDMIVLGPKTKTVHQKDLLFDDRGILTLGITREDPEHRGVYWSLPLHHLRYYGLPVARTRSINSAERTRITVDQLVFAAIAAYLHAWDDSSLSREELVHFFANMAGQLHIQMDESLLYNKQQSWLALLAKGCKPYLNAITGEDKSLMQKLWNLGRNHCSILRDTEPFMNLFSLSTFIRAAIDIEDIILVLRDMVGSLNSDLEEEYIIRYPKTSQTKSKVAYEYATAVPQYRNKRTYDGDAKDEHCRWIVHHITTSIAQDDSDSDSEIDFDNTGLWGCPSPLNGLCAGHNETIDECIEDSLFSAEKESKEREKKKNLLQAAKKELDERKRQIQLMGETVYPLEDLVVKDGLVFIEVATTRMKRAPTCAKYMAVLGHPDQCQLFRLVKKDFFDSAFNSENVGRNCEVQDNDLSTPSKDGVHGEPPSFDSLFHLTTKMKRDLFTANRVSLKRCAQILCHELLPDLSDQSEYRNLQALSTIADIYSGLNGATLDVQVLKCDLSQTRWLNSVLSWLRRANNWAKPLSRKGPLPMNHALSFACIVMMETGRYDLDPAQLKSVMALSAADSVYVVDCLLSDPAAQDNGFRIRRLTGNIGRPGLAFLVPPVEPMTKKYDALDEWQHLDNAQFDGRLEDNFAATSLQLRFTEATFPIDVGFSGGRDVEAYFLEMLVSVYDSGQWVADLDVVKAFSSLRLYPLLPCSHSSTPGVVGKPQNPCTSIDTYAELLCSEESTSIVRARGNWQARLAATVLCIMRGYHVLVLPEAICWNCMEKTAQSIHRKLSFQQVVFVG
ncbi:hypothetical protein ASPZODRAFT_557669 [Penicilliopsis zonata CBS 506.65]|uniref:Uncharacterized protein n=1 Tax=Penicilliopsis zonata CBS 506.65 TaxID=1073090 RepID=A0A1L9SDJ0_9EURO|nr:hypothetical protein ASPZODRAFT_557669 [Penicilliopsis zonata CBS 506.65]OJJ45239.1 hypothetical protein ASPZODRAFT_557669 [Penicilliopsis zonata CBS 506.65]